MICAPDVRLGPAIQALMAGEVDLAVGLPANVLGQVHAGTSKAFAVTAKTRLEGAPDIPTVDEAGLEGFYQSNWHALYVPKGTPSDIVNKLNAAVNAVLAKPALAARFHELGGEPMPMSPAEFGKLVADETVKWAKVVKSAGLKAE